MRKLLALFVSLGLLALLYSRLDTPRMLDTLARCDKGWLLLGLGMVIPLTLLTGWRLTWLAPASVRMGLGEAVSLTLAASVLNLLLPSKMGDLIKAAFIRDRDARQSALALPLVVFEKTLDTLSLLAWCAVGLLMQPKNNASFWLLTAAVTVALAAGWLLLGHARTAEFLFRQIARPFSGCWRRRVESIHRSWLEMHRAFWSRRAMLFGVVAVSLFIWFLHLAQIWMFIRALGQNVPYADSMGLSALAIFAGLLPLTLAGVGTRDTALLLFYAPYMPREAAAALGWLCTTRYLLPALGGLPFLRRHLHLNGPLNSKS